MHGRGKVRLGGMALANGVLVHGPTRGRARSDTDDGRVEGRRPAQARSRAARSRARSCAARPGCSTRWRSSRRSGMRFPRRSCPSSDPPCSRRCSASATVVRLCAARLRLGPLRRSSSAVCSPSRRPRSRCGARSVAAYHGAEHISIGSYEQGKRATKEHNRCGSHLLGPLLATTAIGNMLASRFRRTCARTCTPRSAARSRSQPRPRSSAGWCGIPRSASHERSRSRVTSCSTDSRPRSRHRSRSRLQRPRSPRASSSNGNSNGRRAAHSRSAPTGDLRPSGREDARGLLRRRVLQPRARDALAGRSPSARRDAGLSEEERVARRDGRGDRHPQALLVRLGRADRPRSSRR